MTTIHPKGPSGTEKTRILSGLTHELRTPLGSILMMSELLTENPSGNLDDREARYAGNIHRAAADLLELVDQVGELARIEAHRLRPGSKRVEPAVLARRIEERFADRRGTGTEEAPGEATPRLEVEVGDDAPATVETDVEKAERILALLVESALKVTEDGLVQVRFGRGDGAALRVEVRDTGPPLTDEERDALFLPFATAGPRSSRHFGGSGLGLPLAHALTRHLGGELTAASDPDGCRYSLVLPQVPEDEAES